MAGNEIDVVKFLLRNKGKIEVNPFGTVISVAAPLNGPKAFKEIMTEAEVSAVITEDAKKKADIYINGHGVSIKQRGGSFAYNRLQRAEIVTVLSLIEVDNKQIILSNLDKGVLDFHQGIIERRNRPWEHFFTETEFKGLLLFLMMKGSPNNGVSNHPAEFILEAAARINLPTDVLCYSFEDYFKKYKEKLKIAFRRQWVGQNSKSEHGRASGLTKKAGNQPWVFENVIGEPRCGWQSGFPASQRKTVYFLMIEKEA